MLVSLLLAFAAAPPPPPPLVPVAFQGRWDESAEACANATGDASMTLTADFLTLYAGEGPVTRAAYYDEDRSLLLHANITTQEDGVIETGEMDFALSLSADGRELTEGSEGGSFTRVRCP